MDKHIIGENAGTLWQLLNEDKIQIELNKTGGKAYIYLMLNVYIG